MNCAARSKCSRSCEITMSLEGNNSRRQRPKSGSGKEVTNIKSEDGELTVDNDAKRRYEKETYTMRRCSEGRERRDGSRRRKRIGRRRRLRLFGFVTVFGPRQSPASDRQHWQWQAMPRFWLRHSCFRLLSLTFYLISMFAVQYYDESPEGSTRFCNRPGGRPVFFLGPG